MIKWLKDLGASLGGIFGVLQNLWGKIVQVKDRTLSIFTDLQSLLDDVFAIIDDIKNFSINPKWNSRVISAPRAVEKIQELYDVPIRIVNDVRDLVKLLKEKIEPAEVNTEDVEALDGLPGKLLKAGEKLLGFATLVLDSLVAITSAIADLKDITTALRQTLEDLQGLDALFLPQNSSRKKVDITYSKRKA